MMVIILVIEIDHTNIPPLLQMSLTMKRGRRRRTMTTTTNTDPVCPAHTPDQDPHPARLFPQPKIWSCAKVRSNQSIPSAYDIMLTGLPLAESAIEDSISARKTARKEHRADVHAHKSARRDLEDEVAPRAEPGTHERRLERRRDNAAANRSFAETRRGGSPMDAAPEEELMGSGENDLQTIKRTQEKEERKKNEREIKREEILRARTVEREERVQRYRQKEDETIGWLKALAKQRFG